MLKGWFFTFKGMHERKDSQNHPFDHCDFFIGKIIHHPVDHCHFHRSPYKTIFFNPKEERWRQIEDSEE
jgi:hypothetical protein